jgi:hypothetical protein
VSYIKEYSLRILTYSLSLKKRAFFSEFYVCICIHGGTRWRRWLRHRATSRKVADSIPDVVTGILHFHKPSGPTVALVSTQLLKKYIFYR